MQSSLPLLARRFAAGVCPVCAALLAALLSGPAHAAAAARVETLTLKIEHRVPQTDTNGASVLDTKRQPVLRSEFRDESFESVVLENEYLKATFVPAFGGPLYRCVYKPAHDDLFFCEFLYKDWYTFWESGVKASMPKAEHAFRHYGQPASYRVYRAADGAVVLAQWMEFSRHTSDNPARSGGFSRLLLSQLATLRPGAAQIRLTYRIVNPSPWRQGRRVWNDAFFPRNQGAHAAIQAFDDPPTNTLSELIYPAQTISFHRGEQLRVWNDAQEGRLGAIVQRFNSYFAWNIPYGFTGIWYPNGRVNRLRLWDPTVAPGAKIYFEGENSSGVGKVPYGSNYNFVEVWGGTDNLFEGVEHWLEPGEVFTFTHVFQYVKGIGKVTYADERVAVHVESRTAAPVVEAVTPVRVAELAATWQGKSLGAPRPCAPDRPAVFALPPAANAGCLGLIADGVPLLDRQFPLPLPDDAANVARIKAALNRGDPSFGERFNDYPEAGMSYRNSIAAHPDGTVARGRVLYRDGQLEKAGDCLRRALATDAGNGEGWHLLGCASLEQGQTETARDALEKALAAAVPYPAAHYYLALIAMRAGDTRGAVKHLADLEQTIPAHWEARLLRARLAFDLPAAQALVAADPADPRAAATLLACAQSAGDEALARATRQALDALSQEPGAPRRLAEFNAAARGVYLPPARYR